MCDNNFLSNTIPDGLATLVEMKLLQLNANYLTGSVPNGLADLTNLETLLLFDNQYLQML